MAGCTLNRAGLSTVRRKVNTWPDSLGGPADRLVAQPGTVCGAVENTTWFGPAVKLGASLTRLTRIVAVPTAVLNAVGLPLTVVSAWPPLMPVVWSQARKVKLAVPLKSGLGRKRIRSLAVAASTCADAFV